LTFRIASGGITASTEDPPSLRAARRSVGLAQGSLPVVPPEPRL
jgi:hypothetical protein